jgi:uncharacterized membrane protein SpoIIM required for sporulation
MELARFVRLRRPVWDAFEAGLERLRRRPRGLGYAEVEGLALAYRQVLHDHALAAARYPGTGVAARLARLALEGTFRLHGDRRKRRGGLAHFFGERFPRAFRAHRGPLAVAAALFLGGAVLGLLLAAVRPGLGVALLGPEAVAGLSEGRLWTESLVSTVPPAASSSAIARNNLSVALTAWAGGAAAGLFALYIVLLNGVLLGAIFGVTLHYSMAGELGEFVVAHGLLELTLVVVAAAAGLGVGRALVAADDRPRGEAVRAAAAESLALMGGCLPWFVLLAVVEVLVSPAPEVPVGVKAAVGVVLEGLFLTLALSRPAPAAAE